MSEMSDSPNSNNYAAKALVWLAVITPVLSVLFLWISHWENGIIKNTLTPIIGVSLFASYGIAFKKIVKIAEIKKELEYVAFWLAIVSLVLLGRVLQAIWPA